MLHLGVVIYFINLFIYSLLCLLLPFDSINLQCYCNCAILKKLCTLCVGHCNTNVNYFILSV